MLLLCGLVWMDCFFTGKGRAGEGGAVMFLSI